VFLKERLHAIQLAGILLDLISIYFFSGGREEAFSASWLAFAIVPIALWGIAALLQKMCTNDISAELSTLSFLAAQVPTALLLLARHPMNWPVSTPGWAWSIALGFFLAVGNLTLLAAFASGGKAAIVSPLTGLYSLVTIPLAVGVMGDKVRPREWVAIGLALFAVVALAHEPKPGNSAS
jgi:drug/metabolite transporter (DMT)-like permease